MQSKFSKMYSPIRGIVDVVGEGGLAVVNEEWALNDRNCAI